MQLKPVLLETPLTAIFHWFVYTLRTGVKRDELLIKFFAFTVIVRRVVYRILLILPHVLQRTFVVLALRHMNHFVVRGFW